jgi:hypothetical protein
VPRLSNSRELLEENLGMMTEKKYLIFASRDESGILRTSICAPNQIFDDDEAFLKQKNEILKAL